MGALSLPARMKNSFRMILLTPACRGSILAPPFSQKSRGGGTMKIFCLSESFSIRVGRRGIWIWAPAVSAEPIYLDDRRLAEMGLGLLETREGRSGISSPGGPSFPAPSGPNRFSQ